MSYVGYLLFRFVIFVFSLIPFWLLYRISDGLAWLLYKVVKYRRKVVFSQLTQSFPNKNKNEIARIAKASYANLADVIVESIKGFTMSAQELKDRYKFLNIQEAIDLHRRGISSIHIAPHYNNWEWGAMSYPLWLPDPVLGFYKPLSNPYIDQYSQANRGRFNLQLIPIGETALAFEQYKEQATTYVFMSDQSTWSDKAHWVTFLGQDTACPYGPDKYARLLNLPTFYLDVRRIKRGWYELYFEPLTDANSALKEAEITELFMKRLEKTLYDKPEYWLWSHKRWKKKRQ